MFEKIWDFFADGRHRFSKKILFSITGIVALLAVDYFFRFSDTYISDKKIEQLDKIEQLLKQDSIRIEARLELVRLEKAVIKRQGFWDFLASSISLIQHTITSPNEKIAIPIKTSPIIKDTVKSENVAVRSVFWHIISSSFVFIIVPLIILVVLIFGKAKTSSDDIGTFIGVSIGLAIATGISSFALAQLKTYNPPVINYGINFVLHICSIALIVYIINLQQKNEKKPATNKIS